MAKIRMPNIYSPYAPRPKRSAQLIVIWMAILVVALVVTFYLTTRERSAFSYESMVLDNEQDDGTAMEPAPGGENVAKMVP
ncbi:hypothetical protein GGR54DRAFT_583340 [Hypoxylon sp. NC1633]|nr:hypothetical protein GGR54DRAFT_583340 [Hypoxylon sp. NC1633]